jgi:hypothetical protein
MKSPHWLGAWCVLLGSAIALPVAAQKPAPSGRRDDRLERRDERRAQHEAAREERHGQPDAARQERRDAMRELREARREERLDDLQGTVDERRVKLREKLNKMRESRPARAEADRARLLDRWGPVRDNPALRNEFRHHAWRMARLRRIRLLAVTEGREPLKVRVEQLIAKEDARHEQAMQRFSTPAPSASASQGGVR